MTHKEISKRIEELYQRTQETTHELENTEYNPAELWPKAEKLLDEWKKLEQKIERIQQQNKGQ